MWEANHCLFSLPEDPPCNVGLGMEEGEGILAPDAAEKVNGLGREKAIAGLWGASLTARGCHVERPNSSGEQCHERAPWHLKHGTLSAVVC